MSTVYDRLRAAGVEVYDREDWGSPQEKAGAYARRRRTHPMPAGAADFHFLHITVTRDTDTVKEGAAGARQIEGYGYSSPPMVSYQDLVTNEGRVFEGQDYGTKGTHTVNDKKVSGYPRDLNLVGYATALMQNVGDAVTDEQVRVVAMIFAARELAGVVRRGAPIHPHRKFAWKSCPGDKAVDRLDEISRLRTRFVRDGLPKPVPPARPGRTEKTIQELTEEIVRTRKARDAAAARGEDPKPHRDLIRSLKATRAIARLVPKR